jgi:hypothetical protein
MGAWRPALGFAAAVGVAVAMPPSAADAEPLTITFPDAATCMRLTTPMPAPCTVRCGNLDYKPERAIWRWNMCDMSKLFAQTSRPTPSGQTPCERGDVGWCTTWLPATGTTLCARCK